MVTAAWAGPPPCVGVQGHGATSTVGLSVTSLSAAPTGHAVLPRHGNRLHRCPGVLSSLRCSQRIVDPLAWVFMLSRQAMTFILYHTTEVVTVEGMRIRDLVCGGRAWQGGLALSVV